MVQKIKHTCGFKKVGHAGTLDPLAEGVLIVLTDEDTKRQDEVMRMKKEYLVKMAFGYESDSHDLGTPIRSEGESKAVTLTYKALQTTLEKYVGKIRQQVPAYSAVHIDGQRLYGLARSGLQNMALPYKEIEIYDIEIRSFITENVIIESLYGNCTTTELRVVCGRGTYIRSLARDIGKDVNSGALVLSLLRTKVGEYVLKDSLAIDEVLLKHLKS